MKVLEVNGSEAPKTVAPSLNASGLVEGCVGEVVWVLLGWVHLTIDYPNHHLLAGSEFKTLYRNYGAAARMMILVPLHSGCVEFGDGVGGIGVRLGESLRAPRRDYAKSVYLDSQVAGNNSHYTQKETIVGLK